MQQLLGNVTIQYLHNARQREGTLLYTNAQYYFTRRIRNFCKLHAGLDIKHVQKQTNKALSHGGLLQHALPNRGNVRAAHTHPVQAVVVLRPGRPPFYLILRVDWSLDVFILDVLDVCKH